MTQLYSSTNTKFQLEIPAIEYTQTNKVYTYTIKVSENLKSGETAFPIKINGISYNDANFDFIFEPSKFKALNILNVEFLDADRHDQSLHINVKVIENGEISGADFIAAYGRAQLPDTEGFKTSQPELLSTNVIRTNNLQTYITKGIDYSLTYNSEVAEDQRSLTDSVHQRNAAIQNDLNITDNKLKYSNLHQDRSSSLLIRTNPNLTGNIKLVVTADESVYFDTFKVSQTLSKKQYRRQKIDLTNSYSYDLRKIYKSMPKYDFYQPNIENLDLYSVDTDKNHHVDLTYSYGCETNDDALYSENYSILAPLYINTKLPDYFCVFRVDSDSTNVKDVIRKSTLVKSYSFKDTQIGKYLNKHLESIKSIEAPITVQLTNNDDLKTLNENTITGISVETGLISRIKETTYRQDSILDQPRVFEDLNIYLSESYQRNNLVAYNIVNLCFMFNDPDVKAFTSNRYIGLYLSENDFIRIASSSELDGVRTHKNGANVIDTSFIEDRYSSIFNKADLNDLFIFAIRDGEVKRVMNQSDYTSFVKDKILHRPASVILETAAKRLTSDVLKYKEFSVVELDKSLPAGNHIRIVLPDAIKLGRVGFTNMTHHTKIGHKDYKTSKPIIIDVIASNNSDLYKSEGYTKIPVVIEDKGEALEPVRFARDFNGRYLDVDTSSFTRGVLFGNPYMGNLEFKDSDFNGFQKNNIDSDSDFDSEGNGSLKATSPDANALTFVLGAPAVQLYDLITDDNYKDFVLTQKYIDFFYTDRVAKVIQVSFLVDSTDNSDRIKTNLDYAYTSNVSLANTRDQVTRIIGAINTALSAHDIDLEIRRLSDTKFAILSNYTRSTIQHVYGMPSIEDRSSITGASSIIVNSQSISSPVINNTFDILNTLLVKDRRLYALQAGLNMNLGPRKYTAYSFIENDGNFVELSIPDSHIIDHGTLYRSIDPKTVKLGYHNIQPFNSGQIQVKMPEITKGYIQNLVNNEYLLDNFSAKYTETKSNNVYFIESPLTEGKKIIKARNSVTFGSMMKLYKSYSHAVALMGINNIVDFNFNICNNDWILTNTTFQNSPSVTPFIQSFNFDNTAILDGIIKRPAINDQSISRLISHTQESYNLLTESTKVPYLDPSKYDHIISTNKIIGSSILSKIKDNTLSFDVIDNLLGEDINTSYIISRYNSYDRVLSFRLANHIINIQDDNLDIFMLSNYDFYTVQYIPLTGRDYKSQIYFIFESASETLRILHIKGSDKKVGTGTFIGSRREDTSKLLGYSNKNIALVNHSNKLAYTSGRKDNHLIYDTKNRAEILADTYTDFYYSDSKSGDSNLSYFQYEFETAEKTFIFRGSHTVDIKTDINISIRRENILKSEQSILSVPVNYDYNVLSRTSNLPIEKSNLFNINTAFRNINISKIEPFTEYRRFIFKNYIDKEINKVNIYKTDKDPMTKYFSYKELNDKLNEKTNELQIIDQKSYFNGPSISLNNAFINISDWTQTKSYSVSDSGNITRIKINLDQVFLDFAIRAIMSNLDKSIKNIDPYIIKDYVIERFSKYYRFDKINTVLKIYKSREERQGPTIVTSLTASEKRLDFVQIQNINADITRENNITYYTTEINRDQNYQYYFELTFSPISNATHARIS